MLGEDLGPLNVKELQNLEKQLEGALALARQRKVRTISINYHLLHSLLVGTPSKLVHNTLTFVTMEIADV